MKGQTSVVEGVGVAIAVAVIVLVGLVIYGVTQNIYPHDEVFTNESMCTTCVNETAYVFDNVPITNDTTVICYNDTRNLMTNGVNDPTCLGYNVLANQQINITNTSNDQKCQITDVTCTYTQNNADDERQSFYTSVNTTIYSGFVLAAVIVLIVAAALIITIVFFLRA